MKRARERLRESEHDRAAAAATEAAAVTAEAAAAEAAGDNGVITGISRYRLEPSHPGEMHFTTHEPIPLLTEVKYAGDTFVVVGMNVPSEAQSLQEVTYTISKNPKNISVPTGSMAWVSEHDMFASDQRYAEESKGRQLGDSDTLQAFYAEGEVIQFVHEHPAVVLSPLWIGGFRVGEIDERRWKPWISSLQKKDVDTIHFTYLVRFVPEPGQEPERKIQRIAMPAPAPAPMPAAAAAAAASRPVPRRPEGSTRPIPHMARPVEGKVVMAAAAESESESESGKRDGYTSTGTLLDDDSETGTVQDDGSSFFGRFAREYMRRKRVSLQYAFGKYKLAMMKMKMNMRK